LVGSSRGGVSDLDIVDGYSPVEEIDASIGRLGKRGVTVKVDLKGCLNVGEFFRRRRVDKLHKNNAT